MDKDILPLIWWRIGMGYNSFMNMYYVCILDRRQKYRGSSALMNIRHIMSCWKVPNINIEYIVLACYPPRSDTSQDGGSVGLNETRKRCVICFLLHWQIAILYYFGICYQYISYDLSRRYFKETEDPNMLYLRFISLRGFVGDLCFILTSCKVFSRN
jgi:hypothetical protein